MMDPIRESLRQQAEKENRDLIGMPANQEALEAFREKREADFTGL